MAGAGVIAAGVALVAAPAWAGPPFLTDDPQPVDLHHWEFYAASQWSVSREAQDGTLPHFEVNYGALPELQLHAIVPAAISIESGQPTRYGLGDVELGAKFRFIDEAAWRPQVGTFPLVVLPTGSASRHLGAGVTQVLLPIWIQKSFGSWTTYGGGGLRLSRDAKDAVAGWLVQRELVKGLTLGTEAFLTVPTSGGGTELQLNLGVIVDASERHHLLLSGGPAFGDDARAQGYVAYQLTI
jgi:hypothetical protein